MALILEKETVLVAARRLFSDPTIVDDIAFWHHRLNQPMYLSYNEFMQNWLDKRDRIVCRAANNIDVTICDKHFFALVVQFNDGDRPNCDPLLMFSDQSFVVMGFGYLFRDRALRDAAFQVFKERKTCARCGARASLARKLRVCSACRSVRYCNAACQAADWDERHRAVCTHAGRAAS